MMEEYSFLYKISIWVIPIVLAVTLHEAAHGWVAWKLGDRTAFNQGRVTFNPIKHIDFFGTLVLPAILLLASGGKMSFGYAKPVPVNYFTFMVSRNAYGLSVFIKRDSLVSLAYYQRKKHTSFEDH